MTPEMKSKIDNMTHEQICYAWRFSPSGDPLFEGSAYLYLKAKFDRLGGFTPEISKNIGWSP